MNTNGWIELPIGTEVLIGGEKIKVVEGDNCQKCCLHYACHKIWASILCDGKLRADKKNVIFELVKKGGGK